MSEMVHIHRFECHGRNKEFVPLDEYRALRDERDRLLNTPAGQRWTRSKPTVPGWYWWRVSPNTRPDLVLLRKGGAGSEDTVLCDVIGTIERGEWSFSDKRCCLLKDLVSGEFQGPLTPNEATAK